MKIIEVGKPYNGPVPQQDGLYFEIGPDGDMQMIIQFQKPSREEKMALAYGILSYSLYRYQGSHVLACWVFEFHAPVSYMDAPFYAGLYTDDRVRKFLATDQNLLQVVILDGSIVQGLRAVGLQWKAMQTFRDIVREQAAPVSRGEYDAAVNALYVLQSKEIFERGKIFKHREDQE
jgi:hypothetical protein